MLIWLRWLKCCSLYSFPYDNQSEVLYFSEDEKIKYKTTIKEKKWELQNFFGHTTTPNLRYIYISLDIIMFPQKGKLVICRDVYNWIHFQEDKSYYELSTISADIAYSSYVNF